MATRLSDHFSATGDDGDALDTQKRVSAGIGHARFRYKRATATGLFLTTDTVRMMTFKSGDRLSALWISTDGGSTAGAVNIGLYLRGAEHDGAAVDTDLFASALTVSTALDRTEALTESNLSGQHRGLTLWEQGAVGAGSDTEDPQTEYDIVIVPSTSLSVADSEIVLEAYYSSGD